MQHIVWYLWFFRVEYRLLTVFQYTQSLCNIWFPVATFCRRFVDAIFHCRPVWSQIIMAISGTNGQQQFWHQFWMLFSENIQSSKGLKTKNVGPFSTVLVLKERKGVICFIILLTTTYCCFWIWRLFFSQSKSKMTCKKSTMYVVCTFPFSQGKHCRNQLTTLPLIKLWVY